MVSMVNQLSDQLNTSLARLGNQLKPAKYQGIAENIGNVASVILNLKNAA